MADGMNHVHLVGNLCDDANHRDTSTGRHVARFRVAVSTTYADDHGEKQTRCDYLPCVWWGRRPQGAKNLLIKGARVAIYGELTSSRYSDDAGKAHHRLEVTVYDMTFERLPERTQAEGTHRDGQGATT